MRSKVIRQILDNKIIAIVRGADETQALAIAKALYDGGVIMVEVTFNQKDPSTHIRTVNAIRATTGRTRCGVMPTVPWRNGEKTVAFPRNLWYNCEKAPGRNGLWQKEAAIRKWNS